MPEQSKTTKYEHIIPQLVAIEQSEDIEGLMIILNTVGGDVEVKNLADLDWWNNKFYSAYGVPKQYYGWTDDAAGFNGGTSLAILSSEFSKAVKRVQNALIQMLTDAINLFLLNKGCKSYLNNFTLKMKAPVTQEEIDYRTEFTNKINAISSLQGLFTDVEDKARRLRILKALIAPLNYGDEVMAEIDAEIAAVEEAAAQAEEEAALEGDEVEATEAPAETNDTEDVEDVDLGTLADLESFNTNGGSEVLMEEQEILNEELKVLIELNKNKDRVFNHEMLISYNEKYEEIKKNMAESV